LIDVFGQNLTVRALWRAFTQKIVRERSKRGVNAENQPFLYLLVCFEYKLEAL
jgi:hypothetical protein